MGGSVLSATAIIAGLAEPVPEQRRKAGLGSCVLLINTSGVKC